MQLIAHGGNNKAVPGVDAVRIAQRLGYDDLALARYLDRFHDLSDLGKTIGKHDRRVRIEGQLSRLMLIFSHGILPMLGNDPLSTQCSASSFGSDHVNVRKSINTRLIRVCLEREESQLSTNGKRTEQ